VKVAFASESELNWKRLLPYLRLLSLRVQSAAVIESVLPLLLSPFRRCMIDSGMERQVGGAGGSKAATLGLANSALGRKPGDRRSRCVIAAASSVSISSNWTGSGFHEFSCRRAPAFVRSVAGAILPCATPLITTFDFNCAAKRRGANRLEAGALPAYWLGPVGLAARRSMPAPIRRHAQHKAY